MSDLHLEERIIGSYGGDSEGPTIICIGGLHGNEPAGVLALRSIFDTLEQKALPFKGRLIGVAGNLKALAQGVRYIDSDLNRIWRPEEIDKLMSDGNTGSPGDIEEAERKELIDVFVRSCSKNDSPVYFLDLHTTSSTSAPFITIADTLRNRAFALNFPVPVILGIEERLDSTMLNYINDVGYIAVGFEAGRHDDPSSVESCLSALWITLVNAGSIDKSDAPELKDHYTGLKAASGGNQGVYEVRIRYGIENDSTFIMEPGYENFKRIKKGELLARSGTREIRSPENGRIFMPLYQKQGFDGFFIIKEINPFWLGVSSILRRLRAEAILPSLPGIQGLDGKYDTLTVDNRIAKWYVIEVLHLLGYRRAKRENGQMIVRKRAYDVEGPKDYSLSHTAADI